MAKDVVDILKQESQQSNEPIAVKMVKAEDDKIEITNNEKVAAILSISCVIGIVITFIISFAIISTHGARSLGDVLPFTFAFVFVFYVIGWFFKCKAGNIGIIFQLPRQF